MKKYRAEAMRFAGQVMLATGYFNTRLPTEQPKTEINYTGIAIVVQQRYRVLFCR